MVLLHWALFVPGSRAGVMEHYGHDNVTITDGSRMAEVRAQPVDGRLLAEVNGSDGGRSPYGEILPWFLGGLFLATVAGSVCHMMPGLGGGSRTGNFKYSIPQAWSPENDNNYSFRAYMTDISLWVMLTDLAPYQQCTAIIMRLGGQARELARMISPQEKLMSGGWRDGALLDPVTYLLGALQLRFANLEDETCLQSLSLIHI